MRLRTPKQYSANKRNIPLEPSNHNHNTKIAFINNYRVVN